MRKPDTVALPLDSTAGAVEESLHGHFLSCGSPYPHDLVLDLSGCRYIEVPALIVLIALFADRTNRGLETSLLLPEKKEVRDFLRVWNFPAALRDATSRQFSAVVRSEHHRFFGENTSAEDLAYAPRLKDPGISRLVFQNFFSLMSFHPRQVSKTRLVTDESGRWSSVLVRSVLSKHLRGPEGYVAARIVYESMMNAARHPNASLILAGSKFDAPGEEHSYQGGHFSVCIWDNGYSMVDTLLQTIADGKPVRIRESPNLYRKHLLVLKDDEGGTQKEYEVWSGTAPTRDTPEFEVLFATTYPGVSRDPEGIEHETHLDLKVQNPELSGPGMGLHVLLNAAIDVFEGSVAFRTKGYFMNVKKLHKDDMMYRAKIVLFDKTKMPSFLGNMVTVRLPLRPSV